MEEGGEREQAGNTIFFVYNMLTCPNKNEKRKEKKRTPQNKGACIKRES